MIDPGFTHSYVSPSFASRIDIQHVELLYSLTVTTLVRKQVIYHSFYKNCGVKIGDYVLAADQAVMDCFNKTVKLKIYDMAKNDQFEGGTEKVTNPCRHLEQQD